MIPEDSALAKLLFSLIKLIETDLKYSVTATDGPPPGWRVLPPTGQYYFVIRMDSDRHIAQLVIAMFKRPVAAHVHTIWVHWADSPQSVISDMRQAVIRQLINDHASGPS